MKKVLLFILTALMVNAGTVLYLLGHPVWCGICVLAGILVAGYMCDESKEDSRHV